MKLLRYVWNGVPRVGVVKGDGIVDIQALHPQFTQMRDIVFGGSQAVAEIERSLANASPSLQLSGATLLAPIEKPGKYLAIGLNYRKHAEESAQLGVVSKPQQLWFNKQTTCISGPYDVIDPGVTEKLDYEVEIAFVIGSRARYVAEADAHKHIAGYTICNDVSERYWQKDRKGQWVKGKSFETSGPVGPWIVTADEIPDVHALAMTLDVNGQRRQNGTTANMIFKIPFLLHYVTQFMVLEPGDIVTTGTPAGVALGMTPPVWLKAGDELTLAIDHLGVQRQTVVPFAM